MSDTTPVITVDGPSGAGKGTLCKALAGICSIPAQFIACWRWPHCTIMWILSLKRR